MAVLYITEYENPEGAPGRAAIMFEGGGTVDQTVAIDASSAQSDAFAATTRVIRVHTDAICSIKIGADPTASATTKRMAADQTEYFAVVPGHKIAVITNT